MPGRTRKTEDESSQDASMQDAPPSAQAVPAIDEEMRDDLEADGEDEEDGVEEEEIEPQRVRIVRLFKHGSSSRRLPSTTQHHAPIG